MQPSPLVSRYLDALVGLRESPFLSRCKRITRLRLQAELYSLTQVPCCSSRVWGPQCAPSSDQAPCRWQGRRG